MDNFPARPSHDHARPEHALPGMGDPSDLLHADDPLGDEAAFPSTWQLLGPAEDPND